MEARKRPGHKIPSLGNRSISKRQAQLEGPKALVLHTLRDIGCVPFFKVHFFTCSSLPTSA